MISLGGVGAALVDKIEFSAENAMVGLLLFWPRVDRSRVLALSQNFEFLRRKKTVIVEPQEGLYVRTSLCTYIEASPGGSSLSDNRHISRNYFSIRYITYVSIVLSVSRRRVNSRPTNCFLLAS